MSSAVAGLGWPVGAASADDLIPGRSDPGPRTACSARRRRRQDGLDPGHGRAGRLLFGQPARRPRLRSCRVHGDLRQPRGAATQPGAGRRRPGRAETRAEVLQVCEFELALAHLRCVARPGPAVSETLRPVPAARPIGLVLFHPVGGKRPGRGHVRWQVTAGGHRIGWRLILPGWPGAAEQHVG